jgi:hypothetical protein
MAADDPDRDDRPAESEFGAFLQRLFERPAAAAAEAAEAAVTARQAAGDDPDRAAAVAQAAVPEAFTFTGFLAPGGVKAPWAGEEGWRRLYLDMRRQNWLLIEAAGILANTTVSDRKVPGGWRDVVWVTADTGIGIGRGSPSNEAQFLVGDFTRAADFRSSPNGGTMAASTGVFCEAESVGCCRPSK